MRLPPGAGSGRETVNEEMTMIIRDRRLLVPLAVLCIAISLFLHKVGGGNIPRSSFFEGLFLGLATALAVAGLITARRD
jgi:hypothetical protein